MQQHVYFQLSFLYSVYFNQWELIKSDGDDDDQEKENMLFL